jgi:hypothetical protein
VSSAIKVPLGRLTEMVCTFICKMWHVHSYYNGYGINLVLLYVYRQDVDCRCCRTLGWWEYLDLSVEKWQEVGEICVMGSFIILSAFQVFWGWYKSMEFWWEGHVAWVGERRNELVQNCDFIVLSENDETLAQVTSIYTSYLNHCFRTTVCHTYDNPMLLLWVVYLHVVVL